MDIRSILGNRQWIPQGRLWYDDNQEEYYGTSDFVPLEKGKFYGHPSSLVDLPGMKPDMEALNDERDDLVKTSEISPRPTLSTPANRQFRRTRQVVGQDLSYHRFRDFWAFWKSAGLETNVTIVSVFPATPPLRNERR